jgi:hypothetical protein
MHSICKPIICHESFDFKMAAKILYAQLNAVGYVLVRHDADQISETYLAYLKKLLEKRATRIFQQDPLPNQDANAGDNKRLQILLDDFEKKEGNISPLSEHIQAIRDISDEWFPGLQVNDLNLLFSRKGCSRQVCHYDGPTNYDPSHAMYDQSESPLRSDVPLSVIMPIEHDTTIWLWPGSHTLTREFDKIQDESVKQHLREIMVNPAVRVSIPINSMLLFRQDLVHAGDSFTRDNARIHMYLDNPEITREKGRAYFMDDMSATLFGFYMM